MELECHGLLLFLASVLDGNAAPQVRVALVHPSQSGRQDLAAEEPTSLGDGRFRCAVVQGRSRGIGPGVAVAAQGDQVVEVEVRAALGALPDGCG
jgi:hypothetical protein